jgi:hypothetical protein
MRYKGIVESNSMVHVIEPRTINGRTHFKIVDEGNLKYFQPGTSVYFDLVRAGDNKAATITGKVETEQPSTNLPSENVILFPEKRDSKLSIPSSLNALHFYLVFNPMFNNKIEEEIEGATQAHSFYHLLESRNKTDPSNSFLYWGKLKSSGGNEPLDIEHFAQVLERNTANKKATHLYISDFHFFWVARVTEVCFQLNLETHGKNTLNFYRKNWDKIEAWFKIEDMEILSNNPNETNELISNLTIRSENHLNSRQTSSEDIQITPYLSGLRYPLIIEDVRKEEYFSFEGEMKAIDKRSPLIAHSLSETNNTKKIIYSYAIPEKVFQKLSHQAQDEILSAEMDVLRCDGGTKEDLKITADKVARSYCVALERCIADVVKNSSPASSSAFFACDDFSLGTFSRLLNEPNLSYLKSRNQMLYDLFSSVPFKGHLLKFVNIRNDKSHQGVIDFEIESLLNVRRMILGVGTEGIIMKLYLAAYPELRNILEVRLPKTLDKKSA